MLRLWQRFRGAISFVSDLGGALLFMIAAVGVLAAGIGGTAFVAWGIFPQPFLTFIILGIALGAAGLTLHLLRDQLAPPAKSQGAASWDLKWTSNEQAAAIQRAYQKEFGDSATQKFREAVRRIREELLDNRLVLDRTLVGDPFDAGKLRYAKWQSHEAALIAHADPAPHTDASQAYREIAVLFESQHKRTPYDPHVLQRDPAAEPPLETDLTSAVNAIDQAVETLDGSKA